MKRTHENTTEEIDDDEDAPLLDLTKRVKKQEGRKCPYLSSINRQLLDFDFERVCSISLQDNNVYACLVCGKYFQGRGKGSYASVHSLQANHHVFLNLKTKRYYCLPDDYEVIDPSLADITGLLDPIFTKGQVEELDTKPIMSRTLDGRQYYVGVTAINNLKHTDYINVILQALGHLSLLRDFFLLPQNQPLIEKSELSNRFAMIIKRMWYPKNFRNQISPHELLQEVSIRSKKKFKIGSIGNPVHFLTWFLNELHKDLVSKKRSIIHDCFQGQVQITSERDVKENLDDREEDGLHKKSSDGRTAIHRQVSTKTIPFLHLALDIPPPPLFKDEREKSIIPQEPLFTLLAKFDGVTKQFIATDNEMRTYIITKLPKYLILHINRFTSNIWFTEKNSTIVNFPIKDLDMRPYTTLEDGVPAKTKYNLMANIRHNGGVEGGTYNLHVVHKSSEKWFDIQDLNIQEALPPLIAISEAYLQIYELTDEETTSM